MAIGVLGIMIYTTIILTIVGLSFLFLSKNDKIKNIAFYFLSVFTLVLSINGIFSLPTNDLIGKGLLIFVTLLPLLAVYLKYKSKDKIAYILVTVAIIVAILKFFSFI
ncbi:hypothetical protein [[Clostridium] colinum]|uniref:hypothetical protein n=1 Tax=[Clostridium] colinum TaxID=36835 RepID=UPI002025B193|nr:hypothetical protein [[Clostridium] colinum]